MRKLLILTAMGIISFSLAGHAQNSGNGKVTGNIASLQKPVESASIGLLRAKDSSIAKLAVTDKTGQFLVEKVAAGKYLVVVQSAGFAKYYSEPFSISEEHPVYTIQPVSLVLASKNLGNVTVTSQRPLVEQRLDRTIVNVDASPSNAGTSIMDVLEKSPGISVDKDGNISLKGKQGVMIMMDGKPTYLSAQDLANFLKSMPSNNLDQIEIMTNPPARFDASGNSGVINIKTKKNKIMGYNGSVTTGYSQGIYPKNNNSVNLNYREGKFNFFGNGGYFYNEDFNKIAIVRNFSDAGGGLLSVFDQHSYAKRSVSSFSYKAGADYFMNKKTTLGIVVNGFGSHNAMLSDNTTRINDKNGALITRTQAVNDTKGDFKNVGLNFNLRHVFDTTGKELTADVDYINYSNGSNQFLSNQFFDKLGNKQSPDELLRGILPAGIDIYSAKLDYSQSLKDHGKFEAGIKSSYVKTDNDAQYANWDGTNYVIDATRSNHFLYKENINAAYVNYGKQLNKQWSVQLGLRTENTNMKGNQLTTGQTFDRHYTQVFPTAFVGYVLNKNNQFSLNYGRRIDRPNYQDLNPFLYFLDKYTYQVGNPYLNPQFSHNIELNHTFKGILTTSVNYSITKDIIQDVPQQIDSTNTTFIKKSNIAKRRNIGASVSLGLPLTKWWRTNIYVNIFNNKFTGLVNNGNIEVAGTTYTGNISNQFSFKKGWGAELSGFYRSRAIDGVLVTNPLGAMNIAFSKQILKNKGTIKLGVRDVFYTQSFTGSSKFQNIDLSIHSSRDSRVANLSFTYRFSKGKTAAQRKRGGAADEQNRVNTGGGN